ncbi:hypothetical protein Bbelb_279020 [Branchiostoma belcheri]|nr:hypothetical protein Bbelb_279020 [Branchiostoma belcheri]
MKAPCVTTLVHYKKAGSTWSTIHLGQCRICTETIAVLQHGAVCQDDGCATCLQIASEVAQHIAGCTRGTQCLFPICVSGVPLGLDEDGTTGENPVFVGLEMAVYLNTAAEIRRVRVGHAVLGCNAPNVPPPRHLDMGDNEKKQVVGRYEESDRRYEDVDSAGYSIFALGSGLQRTAPNGPPPRHLDMKDNEKDEVGIRNEESDRMYEDVDPAGESIFTLGSGLQPAAPNEPKYVDMEGKKKKKVDRRNEKSDRKYEDVDPAGESIFEETGEMGEDMSGGVDVIINSGLKRPVPDLPTPRNSDAGDRMAEDKRSEEPCSDPCNEQVDNAGNNAGGMSSFK